MPGTLLQRELAPQALASLHSSMSARRKLFLSILHLVTPEPRPASATVHRVFHFSSDSQILLGKRFGRRRLEQREVREVRGEKANFLLLPTSRYLLPVLLSLIS